MNRFMLHLQAAKRSQEEGLGSLGSLHLGPNNEKGVSSLRFRHTASEEPVVDMTPKQEWYASTLHLLM